MNAAIAAPAAVHIEHLVKLATFTRVFGSTDYRAVLQHEGTSIVLVAPSEPRARIALREALALRFQRNR